MTNSEALFGTISIHDSLVRKPAMNNSEMMMRAYRYYSEKRKEIESRAGEVSAHSRGAAMGAIRLLNLKWIS